MVFGGPDFFTLDWEEPILLNWKSMGGTLSRRTDMLTPEAAGLRGCTVLDSFMTMIIALYRLICGNALSVQTAETSRTASTFAI
jgi:hypothetical protein